MHNGNRLQFKTILVATDLGKSGSSALHYAQTIALLHKSVLVVVHVIDPVGYAFPEGAPDSAVADQIARAELNQIEEETRRQGIPIHSVMETGVVYERLLQTALDHRADLLVLGTRAKTEIGRVALGTVARRLAKQLHCRLHVLHTVKPGLYVADTAILSAELLRIEVERGEKELNEYASRIPEVRTVRHEEIALCGPTIDEISAVTEMKGIDLLVMGSHGRGGLKKMVLGSVAEAAIRRVHCPVLVVGPRCVRRFAPLKSMVFATTLRADSLRSAQYAMSIARQTDAALVVVHVVPEHIGGSVKPNMELESRVAKELRRLIPHDPELERHVHFEIEAGNTAKEILRIAKHSKAGLIVMGVREHSALADRNPWATLSAVIRDSACPVLAVQSHFA